MTRSAAALMLIVVAALPARAAAHRERVVASLEAGRCQLRLEADDEDRTLALRVLPQGTGCRISQDEVRRLLAGAFSGADPAALPGSYTSLFIGRLVEYPWLSAHLASAAAADPQWDRRRGRPVSAGANAYVAALVGAPAAAGPFRSAIAPGGYRIGRAIVEKVLVGGFRDVPGHEGPAPPGKVPFDAMVWFTLERGAPPARGP